jgi:hypothetical protein
MNRIKFQPGMSLSQFLELYDAEEQCEAALEQTRWSNGFRCPRSGEQDHGLVYGRRHRLYQCWSCRHQTTVHCSNDQGSHQAPGFLRRLRLRRREAVAATDQVILSLLPGGRGENRPFFTLPDEKVGRNQPRYMVA